ncbi:MAG: hypothetical protein ACKO8I_14130 [Cyanobacteriota bacterium]
MLLLAWRRPDTTAKLMQRLQQVRPTQLFVACDGVRPGDQPLAEACHLTRMTIEDSLNWPCQVQRLYRDEHRGCRQGVSEALDWFFSHVEAGIVLEDDVLPDPSFFPYCSELLERYRDDDRIAMVSGCAIGNRPTRDQSSYRFSRLYHVWGWATWKRAWQNYDARMDHWPTLRAQDWLEDLGGKRFSRYWRHQLDRVWQGRCDTWDYIWMLSCWRQGQVCILPMVNLVDNLGFNDQRATHTSLDLSPLPRAGAIEIPLRHPGHHFVDARVDGIDLARYYTPRLPRRLLRRLKRDGRRLWQVLQRGLRQGLTHPSVG